MKVDDPRNPTLPQRGANAPLDLKVNPNGHFSASVVAQRQIPKRTLSQPSLNANPGKSKKHLPEILCADTLTGSEKSKPANSTDLSKLPFLKIPMMMLRGVHDPKKFNGLDEHQLQSLPKEYSEDEIAHIKSALKLAMQNKSFNFQSLAPGIAHSNTSIHELLSKIYNSMNNGSNGSDC